MTLVTLVGVISDGIAGARAVRKVELLSILAPATQKGQVEGCTFSHTRRPVSLDYPRSVDAGDGVVDVLIARPIYCAHINIALPRVTRTITSIR